MSSSFYYSPSRSTSHVWLGPSHDWSMLPMRLA